MKRMIAMVLAAMGAVNTFPGELPESKQAPARLEGEQEITPVAQRAAERAAEEWNALDVATEGVVSWIDMAGLM